MPQPTITSVHLIGSIPLANTSEVLRTVSSTLPNRLRRIPDGETGERHYFTRWRAPKIGQWPVLVNSLCRGLMGLETDLPSFTEEKKRVLAEMEERLETGYDDVAMESWEVFKKLKAEGVVGRDVKFLVALPTPLTVTALHCRREFRVGFERVYEGALLRALRRVMDVVPAGELAVQWDCPFEMGILEGVTSKGRDVGKWWEEGTVDGVVERLKGLCGGVREGVEVGVHLCYGEFSLLEWVLI